MLPTYSSWPKGYPRSIRSGVHTDSRRSLDGDARLHPYEGVKYHRKIPRRTAIYRFLLVGGIIAASITLFMLYFDMATCDGNCLYITRLASQSSKSKADQLPVDFPCHYQQLSIQQSSQSLLKNPSKSDNTLVKEEKNLTVPLIIHQTWKTSKLPAKFAQWSDTWRQLHPQWTHKLWTDEDNRQLVKQHYPWFLPTYDGFTQHIMRVDSVRYLYMHLYGGVYADLDVEALRPIDSLVQPATGHAIGPVLALMSRHGHNSHNVPNAWIASTAGHPFWILLINEVMKRASRSGGIVEGITGPVVLTDIVERWIARCSTTISPARDGSLPSLLDLYKQSDVHSGGKRGPTKPLIAGDMKLLPPGLIYPYDWRNSEGLSSICEASGSYFNTTICKEQFPNAYTITYWSHTWGNDNSIINVQ